MHLQHLLDADLAPVSFRYIALPCPARQPTTSYSRLCAYESSTPSSNPILTMLQISLGGLSDGGVQLSKVSPAPYSAILRHSFNRRYIQPRCRTWLAFLR